MDIPKGFKPGKGLGENTERLLDEKLVKKPVTTKIEEALRDYVGECEYNKHVLPVPELAKYIKDIEDLGLFVKELYETQLEGELPLIRVLSKHEEGVTRATYDLFWNPGKDRLEFDWNDTPRAKERLYQFKTEVSVGFGSLVA